MWKKRKLFRYSHAHTKQVFYSEKMRVNYLHGLGDVSCLFVLPSFY